MSTLAELTLKHRHKVSEEAAPALAPALSVLKQADKSKIDLSEQIIGFFTRLTE